MAAPDVAAATALRPAPHDQRPWSAFPCRCHPGPVDLLLRAARRRDRVAVDSIREVVFGVEDGTVQNVALVVGMVGASLSNRVVVIAAALNVASGVLSMAMGTYLSSKAERDVAVAHDRPDTTSHVPVRDAGVMAAAYAVGGLIPLLPFAVGLPRLAALWVSIGVAGGVLFSLGVAKAVASHQSRWRSGVEMLLLATAAGTLGYGLGLVARAAFGVAF